MNLNWCMSKSQTVFVLDSYSALTHYFKLTDLQQHIIYSSVDQNFEMSFSWLKRRSQEGLHYFWNSREETIFLPFPDSRHHLHP